MSRVYTLSEMVDLALATPKIGVVNCFMLHALLHALIKRLDIGDYSASILAMGDRDFPWTTDAGVQPEESDVSGVVKVSQPGDNVRLQIPTPRKTPEPLPEKRASGLVKSKSQRADSSTALPRQGDDAKDKQELLKKQSAGKKGQDSESLKKKPSGPERLRSQRADSPMSPSRQDGDDVKNNKQEPPKRSSSTKKAAPSQSSEGSKKKTTRPERSNTEIIEGEESTEGVTDDADIVPSQDSERLKEEPTTMSAEEPTTMSAEEPTAMSAEELSQEANLESGNVSPVKSPELKRHSQSIGLQFGIPYLESGISALADHIQDVPELIKELTDRIAVNETELKELKENVAEAQGEKGNMGGKVKNIMKSLDSLENTIFQEPEDPQKDQELKELENKMDEMVQMSNALRKKLRSKIKQKDTKDKVPPSKRKSKKESKKAAAAKKEKEPAVATEKKISASEGESSDASDKEKTPPAEPNLKSTEQQSTDTVISPQSDVTPEATTSEAEAGSSKDTTTQPAQVKATTSPFSEEKFGAMPMQRRYSQSSMDVLQKKVNMVLRLMCNLEKIVKDLSLERGKTHEDDKKTQEQQDDVADAKTDNGREDDTEQRERESLFESPKHKHSQVQIPYQMVLNRMKKLEDDIQKIQQIVSSDTSTSSHLTKMVGDFLSTISGAPEPDPQPKRKRKDDKKKKKTKEVGEKDGGEEGGEDGGEDAGEDGEKEDDDMESVEVEKKEKQERGEKEEKSDDEGKTKEMEAEVIDILKDSEPEKLSDLWDQLKALAQAVRNMKCNVVSLEKNSKNMAKALQLLMRGNTNIIDEDFEMIGEMKMVVRKLVADSNNLGALVKQDRELLLSLTVTVDSLLDRFEEMKSLFTGKTENLKDELLQKAERQDVDNMLASVLKKLNITDYRREMDKFKDDIAEQEQNILMDIQQLKNDKYDRFEMDIFRMWVECKLSATQKVPKGNLGLNLYQEDAAILKKQIPFHCLSCDKSIMITPQTLIPTVPEKGGLPPNKRNRPISAHEADPSRLLKQRVQVRKSFIKPLDKMLLEGKDNKLYQGQQIEIPEEVKQKMSHKDQLPPLNGAAPSKSEHTLPRKITGIPERLIENKSSLSSRNIVIPTDES